MSDIPSSATEPTAVADQFDPLAGSIAEGGKPEASVESSETEQPAQSRHSSQLLDYARQVGLTDGEINAIEDSGRLFKMVQGLAKSSEPQQPPPAPSYQPSIPQQPQQYTQPQAAQQPQQQQPAQPQPGLEDFAWKESTEDGEDNETPNQFKELANYVNKVKGSLSSQVEKLAAENAELRGYVQQSAEQAQKVSHQQNSVFWDDVTSNIPGLEDYAGKPSQALAAPGSPNAKRWEDLAGAIKWRAGVQNVPEQFVDWKRAAAEAFAALQSTPSNNNHAGTNGHPGQAARGDYRVGSPPKPPETLSAGDEYDQRLANVQNMFQAHDGNPLAPGRR